MIENSLQPNKLLPNVQVELVEECEEEEIIMDSDDDGEEPVVADRPITPTPIQDFAANVTYKEGQISGYCILLSLSSSPLDCSIFKSNLLKIYFFSILLFFKACIRLTVTVKKT